MPGRKRTCNMEEGANSVLPGTPRGNGGGGDSSSRRRSSRGKEPSKDTGSNEHEPCLRGRWYWLLAEDGTPSTVETSRKKPIVVTPNTEYKKKMSLSRGSWYWLLSPDGTPATADADVTSLERTEEDNEPAEAATSTSGSNRESNPSPCKGWYWLLAPDGSPATRNSATAGPERPSDGIGPDAAAAAAAANVTPERKPDSRGRWHWLLSADGTPATVDTTPIPSSVARKRKRNIESDPAPEAIREPMPRPQRRCCQRKIGNENANDRAGEAIQKPAKKPQLGNRDDSDGAKENTHSLRSRSEKKDLGLSCIDAGVCRTANEGGVDEVRDGSRKSFPRRGKSPSNKRRTAVESIDFQREVVEPYSWMKMYQRLEAYKTKYKNTRVPRSYKADPQLAEWVLRERYSCKKKNRVDLLNEIGFEW